MKVIEKYPTFDGSSFYDPGIWFPTWIDSAAKSGWNQDTWDKMMERFHRSVCVVTLEAYNKAVNIARATLTRHGIEIPPTFPTELTPKAYIAKRVSLDCPPFYEKWIEDPTEKFKAMLTWGALGGVLVAAGAAVWWWTQGRK